MLSIVIVHYSRTEPLRAWLESLSTPCDSRKYEFIIVDNSGQFIPPKSLGVRHVRPDVNRGYASAVNHGCSLANWDDVLVLTDDMYPTAAQIEALIFAKKQLPRRSVLAPTLRFPHGQVSAGVMNRGFRWCHIREHDPSLPIVERDAVDGAAWLVSRQAFEEVGPLREDFFLYWEETEWFSRAKLHGWRCFVLNEPAMETESGSAAWVAYYQARNWLLMYEASSDRMGIVVSILCRALRDLVVSITRPQRWTSLSWRLRGLRDGLRGVSGPGPMHG